MCESTDVKRRELRMNATEWVAESFAEIDHISFFYYFESCFGNVKRKTRGFWYSEQYALEIH